MCAFKGKARYLMWAQCVTHVGLPRLESGRQVPLKWGFRVADVGKRGAFCGLCPNCGAVLLGFSPFSTVGSARNSVASEQMHHQTPSKCTCCGRWADKVRAILGECRLATN